MSAAHCAPGRSAQAVSGNGAGLRPTPGSSGRAPQGAIALLRRFEAKPQVVSLSGTAKLTAQCAQVVTHACRHNQENASVIVNIGISSECQNSCFVHAGAQLRVVSIDK
jgi:hypothetical protein